MNPSRVVLTTVLLLAASVRAEDVPRVVLVFSGSAAERDALSAPVSEVLSRLGVRLTVTDAEPSSSEQWLALVHADWTNPDECVLVLNDTSERVSVRRKLSRAQGMALVDEAAAHVIQSAVDELIAPLRRKAKVPVIAEPPLVEAPVLTPITLAGRERGVAVDVAGFFGGHAFGGAAPISFAAGLMTTLAFQLERWRPQVFLLGEYHPSFDVTADLLSVRAQVVTLRLGGTINLFNGGRWRIDTGLGAGTDVFLSTPTSSEIPGNALSRSRIDPVPVVTAIVAGHYAIARSADLFLAVTVDGDLRPVRYVTEAGPMRTTLFTPWRVRPALVLGFSFTAAGPAPYLESGAAP